MANRLANQTSPYLQQHAANPVDWYPWGPEALERARRPSRRPELSRDLLRAVLDNLRAGFDPRFGGFGAAPKFPHPTDLELCLRKGETDIAHTTLKRMCEGGIYDQLGGGFSRYSVDAQWMIPHFEKMLYDNGPLLSLLADAWLVTGQPLYARL